MTDENLQKAAGLVVELLRGGCRMSETLTDGPAIGRGRTAVTLPRSVVERLADEGKIAGRWVVRRGRTPVRVYRLV